MHVLNKVLLSLDLLHFTFIWMLNTFLKIQIFYLDVSAYLISISVTKVLKYGKILF